MAKLPPKPMNVVHEYFPVGTDGQSPFNRVEPVAYSLDSDAPLAKAKTVARGKFKSNNDSDEDNDPKKMHISANLKELTSDQKNKVVKAGRKDKGAYNSSGGASLTASGLHASNELNKLNA